MRESEISPLHRAVLSQLSSGLDREAAAPGIFLIAHPEFDAAALTVAAGIYRPLSNGRGAAMALALADEAAARGQPSCSPGLAEAALQDLMQRIGLCAKLGPVGAADTAFNQGVRAAQKEVEAALIRLRGSSVTPFGSVSPADSAFNQGVRAAQKEVEAALVRLRSASESPS